MASSTCQLGSWTKRKVLFNSGKRKECELISSQVKVGLRFVVKRNAMIKIIASPKSDSLELKTCEIEALL